MTAMRSGNSRPSGLFMITCSPSLNACEGRRKTRGSFPRWLQVHSHPLGQRMIRPKLSGSDAQKRQIVARDGCRVNSAWSIEPSPRRGNRSKNARLADPEQDSRVPTSSKRIEFQPMMISWSKKPHCRIRNVRISPLHPDPRGSAQTNPDLQIGRPESRVSKCCLPAYLSGSPWVCSNLRSRSPAWPRPSRRIGAAHYPLCQTPALNPATTATLHGGNGTGRSC